MASFKSVVKTSENTEADENGTRGEILKPRNSQSRYLSEDLVSETWKTSIITLPIQKIVKKLSVLNFDR